MVRGNFHPDNFHVGPKQAHSRERGVPEADHTAWAHLEVSYVTTTVTDSGEKGCWPHAQRCSTVRGE